MDGDIARGTWGRASWRPLGDHQVWWCCPETSWSCDKGLAPILEGPFLPWSLLSVEGRRDRWDCVHC